jgi:hypothetical protein
MQTVTLARHAMATRFEIVLHGENAVALRAAGEEALAEVERLENQLSLYRPGSEIAQLNACAAREAVRVPAELFALLEHARRLHDAEDGLRQLLAPWEERVDNARELRDLERIQAELAKVPVAETKRAAEAELLIAAMDESDEAGPADLDGERAHQVRVTIVDIRAAKVLLRLRKHVDPNWLATTTRSNFASAVDGCALALDVRADVAR